MKSPVSWSVISALTLFLATGCTKDKVVGRYATATCVEEGLYLLPCPAVEPAAEVSIVTIPTAPAAASASPAAAPAAAAMNTASQPDRALAACVNRFDGAAAQSVAEKLCQSLAAPAPTPKADTTASIDDRTIFHRTMIVTVAKVATRFNPADRLEATDVVIEPDNAVITTWDTAATAYNTINAGTIALTQAQNATGNLTVTAPPGSPILGNLTGGFSQNESRVENLTGNEQVESLTVSLSNNDAAALDHNRMRIHRQGGIGVDLTGNTIVKMDLVLPEQNEGLIPTETRFMFSVSGSYMDSDGKWTAASKLALKPQLVTVAKTAKPITATVTLTYTLRHIINGDATLEERDDNVIEHTVTQPPQRVILVPGRQVSPRSFGIVSRSGSGVPLQVKFAPNSLPPVLCFDSYEAAQDLLTYIQNADPMHPEKFGIAELGFNGGSWQALRMADLNGLQVESDACH